MMTRESREPIFDVGGIADLARLAVADDVDARRDLLRDGVGDAVHDGGVEVSGLELLTAVLFVQESDDLAAARKAADVRRQDPLGARSHWLPRRARKPRRASIVSYGR